MCAGDVMGHEPMGEVVEVGPEAKARGLNVGDRVVIPFTITCGECEQCLKGNFSVCQTTNRNADLAKAFFGDATAGLFGYSHITGGYAGGQAEYLRVPFAATTAVKLPKDGAGREVHLPLRHPADRLAGGGPGRHHAGRHGRRLGLRPRRAVRDPLGDRARRQARHRHRRCRRAAGAGPQHGRGDPRSAQGRQRAPIPEGDHRRPRPGQVHRRGRHGGARPEQGAGPSRPGADRAQAGDRPPGGPARGDHGLQGRPAPSPCQASMAARPTRSRSAP